MICDVLEQLRSSGRLYAACVVFGLAGALHAQQVGEKLVRVNDPAQITDAVMISNVAVAGKTVECGLFIKPPLVIQPFTPFQAGSHWLEQMTISLINRTGRTIVSGGLIFHFLDTGDCQSSPCVESELHFGQLPEIDAAVYDARDGHHRERPERRPLDWKPEQTIVVRVGDHTLEVEQNLVNHLPVTAVAKVNIDRGPFYFADGMMWSLGRYSVPDPESPGKFKALPADYFPGRRGRNWPPGYNQ